MLEQRVKLSDVTISELINCLVVKEGAMKRALGSDSPKNQCEGSASSQYESAEQKAERNRERNREHAKKTRLRKKEMIEGMKIRLLELQREVSQSCYLCICSANSSLV